MDGDPEGIAAQSLGPAGPAKSVRLPDGMMVHHGLPNVALSFG